MPRKLSFDDFYHLVETDLLYHPIIINNPYTKWFKQGEINPAQMIDLFRQFSVFSNYFLVIQCESMVFADTEEEERCARAILASELGVEMNVHTGDVEGNIFNHTHAHINWLRETALELCKDFYFEPFVLGSWHLGYSSTHKFLKKLRCRYASRNRNRRTAASFAIETWAGFGIGKGPDAEDNNFWRELVVGIEKFNQIHRLPKGLKPIDPRFFQWHFDIEAGHALNVMELLKTTYNRPDFNAREWFQGGNGSLDALSLLWYGLNEARLKLAV